MENTIIDHDTGEIINVNNSLMPINDKVQASRVGLIIKDNLTFAEWQNVGDKLNMLEGGIQWMIGDWLNYGEQRYGEMYTQAMDETRYSYSTLRDQKWVSNQYELSLRNDNLSWSHHRFIADLPQKERQELLEWAEDTGASVSDLKLEKKRRQRQQLADQNGHAELPPTIHLIEGDMLEVLPELQTGIDLVVADPPYNVTEWEWDKIDNFIEMTSEWIDAITPKLSDEFVIFWFCSPRYAADIEMLFREKALPIQSRVIWHRRNMAMGSDAKKKFIDTWEMVYHIGNRDLNFSEEWGEDRFDVQSYAVPQTNFTDTKYHPTQKPEALIRWLVEHGSYEGDTVLDPFAGSGTTGAVCDNRNCILIERDDEYNRIIRSRLGI